MKISKIETMFTHKLNIGRFVLNVETSNNGVYIPFEELLEKTRGFKQVYITSLDNPLNQKEEVAKLCKALVKDNHNVKIEIDVKPIHKPIELSGYVDNTKFNVYVELSKSNKSFDERINVKTLEYFVELDSKIIFEVNDKDDIDEVNTLVANFNIKNQQVYLMSDNINFVEKYCKINNFNICFNISW